MENPNNPFQWPSCTSYWQEVETAGVSSGEQNFVTILVGPKLKPFVVHANVIGAKSPFFKTAFESGFKEGAMQVMTLADTEEAVFRVVMEWVYDHTSLPTAYWAETDNWEEFSAGRQELEWDALMVENYIFAQTYMFKELAASVCGDFVWRLWEIDCEDPREPQFPFPTTHTVERLFGGVPESSKLCEEFALAFLLRLHEGTLASGQQSLKDVPPTFAKTLLVMLASTRVGMPFPCSPAVNVPRLVEIAFQTEEEEEDDHTLQEIQPEIFGVKLEEASRATESKKDAKIQVLTRENDRLKREIEELKKRLA
ncbi:uncharacterized protein J3D65DRAFT_661552 [Phyllosticta citribraziliensis]|uniref:BTB domain-containing protein n=1 Tax=Phyllosticta citribraziliensis TaxID=989973 RepID=A0ABR1LAW0_9PEZI